MNIVDTSAKREELPFVTVILWKNDKELSNGFASSFQLLIPEGYGLTLFRRLVYSGCKPIGHKEYLSLMLECGSPVFPDDFLHTAIGDSEASVEALSRMRKYCARPPSKRLNY